MTTDKSEAFEPSGESAWAGPVEPTRPTEPLAAASSTSTIAKAPSRAATRASQPSRAASIFRSRTFLTAFLIAGAISLLLGAASVMAFTTLSSDKIASGVHAGSVDLSGLSRDEAVAKLSSIFAGLGQGTVGVSTPQGSGSITYEQIGRAPDVEAMADAAMSVGRYGNPLSNFVERFRAVTDGENVPVMVKLDPTALARQLRQITGQSQIEPVDASVAIKDGKYSVIPSSTGKGIDEQAIAGSILASLSNPNAPSTLQIGGDFVTLHPQVSDADAQAGIDASARMVVDVPLTYTTKTYTIPAATIQKNGWIIFGWRSDSTYGPVADPVKVQAWVGDLGESEINIDPVQPKFDWDKATGELKVVTEGKDGLAVDVESTTIGVASYLDALAKGQIPGASVQIVTEAAKPRLGTELTGDALKNFVLIGQGQVYFYPIDSNGYGANIRKPAEIFDGQVVWPGETFSFWGSVGPVDAKHGFASGGVIKDGKSDHTGAIGGGICSASTTMFNAAATAGLQIIERHPHFYWINRYPLGRDATVYTNGVPGQGFDLRWRNDTKYPVIIKSWWTGRDRASSKNWIHIQLFSMPTGRTTAWTKPEEKNVVKASDTTIYVKTLKPGQAYRAEYPTPGKDVTITRTVTDTATGNVLWKNTWVSHYTKVDGILQLGGTAPTPTPIPTPTPAVTPTEAPTPTPAPRRRKLR